MLKNKGGMMEVEQLLKETAESIYDEVSNMSFNELTESIKNTEMKYYPKIFPEWFELFAKIEPFIENKTKEIYVELPHPEAEENFIEQLQKSNSLYFVSGALNPKRGIFADKKIKGYLEDKLRGDSNYKMTIIFGEPIMIRDDNHKNPFFDFIRDNLEKMNVFVHKKELGRPPLHAKIFDNSSFTIEYPHFEFSIFRRLIIGNSPEVVEVIKSFYSEEKLIPITNKRQLSNIKKEVESKFGIRKELNKSYNALKKLISPK